MYAGGQSVGSAVDRAAMKVRLPPLLCCSAALLLCCAAALLLCCSADPGCCSAGPGLPLFWPPGSPSPPGPAAPQQEAPGPAPPPPPPACLCPAPQEALDSWLAEWQAIGEACPSARSKVCYTPLGQAYFSRWGNLHEVANAGLVAVLYATALAEPAEQRYQRCWARSQLLRMAGGLNYSYVIGWAAWPGRPFAWLGHAQRDSCRDAAAPLLPAQPAFSLPRPPAAARPAASAPPTRCGCTTRAAPAPRTWRSPATGECSTLPAPTPTC
jgi:hypothetical protein